MNQAEQGTDNNGSLQPSPAEERNKGSDCNSSDYSGQNQSSDSQASAKRSGNHLKQERPRYRNRSHGSNAKVVIIDRFEQ